MLSFEIPTNDGPNIFERESAEAFRILAEATPAAIFVYQEERILYVNRSMLQLSGYGREELLGMRFWEICHPDLQPLLRERGLARQRGEDVPKRYEMRFLTKEKKERWIDFSADRILLAGRPAVAGTMYDITDRKCNEERLRGVFDNSHDGIVLFDAEGRVAAWNRGMERISLLPSSEAMGRDAVSIEEMLLRAPSDEGPAEESFVRTVRQSLKERKDAPFLYEAPLVRRDGSIRRIQFSGFPMEATGGRMVGLIVRDLTEYRKAQSAAAETERRYADLFQGSVEGLFHAGPDGVFTAVNPSLARFLGFEGPAQLLERAVEVSDRFHGGSAARERFLDRLRLEGSIQGYECGLRRADGMEIWAHVNARAVIDARGNLEHVEGFVQDVSEGKRLIQQLVQSQKMEAVGRLAGGIAHDFNNLLTVILGFAGELEDHGRLGEDEKRSIQEIMEAARRATDLTGQLLAFSRKQVLHPQTVDLHGIVSGMKGMLRRLIGEDIDLSVAPAPGPLPIYADRSQVEQVVMNVAVNSRDAMPHGGALRIGTSLQEVPAGWRHSGVEIAQGTYAVLSVADTGSGMPREVIAHLFEPFFTTKKPGQGTGLGLATVYGIVKQSGGLVTVDSEEGKGTLMTVYFPLSADRETPRLIDEAPVPEAGARERILIVEDDTTLRRYMGSILRTSGYVVTQAENGAAALALLDEKSYRFELMITDVVMPTMGGLELARRAGTNHPDLPILFMSGYPDESPLDPEEESATLHGYLAKPFDRDGLLHKVHAMLHGGTAGVHSAV